MISLGYANTFIDSKDTQHSIKKHFTVERDGVLIGEIDGRFVVGDLEYFYFANGAKIKEGDVLIYLGGVSRHTITAIGEPVSIKCASTVLPVTLNPFPV